MFIELLLCARYRLKHVSIVANSSVSAVLKVKSLGESKFYQYFLSLSVFAISINDR